MEMGSESACGQMQNPMYPIHSTLARPAYSVYAQHADTQRARERSRGDGMVNPLLGSTRDVVCST